MADAVGCAVASELTPRLYIRRRGRMTRGQGRALATQSEQWLLNATQPLRPESAFGRQAPLLVEVGFGMAHALLESAAQLPHWNVLGIEIYRPGIGAALVGIRERNLANVRLLEGDAQQLLKDCIAPASIDQLNVFFPDPWPKKRHHKRRLLQLPFVQLAVSRMKHGGVLHVATDWEPYAQDVRQLLDEVDALTNQAGRGQFMPASGRPSTRFEARGRKLGHQIFDLMYTRSG